MIRESVLGNSVEGIKKDEEINVVEEVHKAREELMMWEQYFNLVSDPRMVDYVIHREDAARARYEYLIRLAKKLGIKGDGRNIVKRISDAS